MIISRTPFRISFFGGGTDYPAWYRREGGAVLSTTIDKYCYLICRYLPPFFEVKHRIVWSHIETVSSIAEILHPAVREGLRFLGFDDSRGVEIHHQGDLPARAGMGSSSAFTVGLLNAMHALRGRLLDKRELALQAIELEQSILKEHVGSQDQVAASYGGLNVIRFLQNGEIQVRPVDIPPHRQLELESHLMLFYVGSSRLSSEVASSFVANMANKGETLRQMKTLVDRSLALLRSNEDLDAFGALLHESWLLKQELNPAVSNPAIDGIYASALANGAKGGKLLGAGRTGFLLFYVPIERQTSVRQALSGYLHVPFAFETEGSTVLFRAADLPPKAPEPLKNLASVMRGGYSPSACPPRKRRS